MNGDLFFWISAVVLVIGGIWLIACGLSTDEPDDPMDEPHGDIPRPPNEILRENDKWDAQKVRVIRAKQPPTR
jgi:hypothetical protein